MSMSAAGRNRRKTLYSTLTAQAMDGLEVSVQHLKSTLSSLEEAVAALKPQTRKADLLVDTMQSKTLFDVLPERVVLQKPLKIRKVVKPVVEKDNMTLNGLLVKYRRKSQMLQQQSKILQLKLETMNS